MSTPNRPPGRLERALGLTFHDPQLLVQALTHRSWAHEHPDEEEANNERLEFLGDAIFQFFVADLLFQHFPDEPEGKLTAMRAGLVSTESFAEIGESLGLAEHVRASRGEATIGGRGRQSIVAGSLEAVVAAAYIDAGLDEARALVHRLIEPRIERAAREAPRLNVKGRLQELIQAQRSQTPEYRVVSSSGPVHAQCFKVEVVARDDVLGRGEGLGKRAAEQRAAAAALDALEALEVRHGSGAGRSAGGDSSD